MPTERHCPECGAPIRADAPGAVCGRCLLKLALDETSDSGDGPPPPTGPPASSAAERPRDLGDYELLAQIGRGVSDGRPPPPGHPASSAAERPRDFGDYELLEQIGRGGMGVVYKARQISLNRIVAIKMIVHSETASPTIKARFHLEAQAAASLEHPNIVSTFEIGEHEGQPFFSMRFIEGSNLAKQMSSYSLSSFGNSPDHSPTSKAQRREAEERIARLTVTMARAVHFAHQHGVVHRDLKPANILIDDQGRPHLMDFGIAKILTGQDALTGTADVLGTVSYMAPEQAAGKPAAGAADIYSLGAILYELLTGRPPFRSDTPLETMRRVVEEEPTHPTIVNRQADKDLATICVKCLEKDPLRRYSSGEALAEDLERWLRHEPVRARRAGPMLRMNRWVRRNPAGAGLIAVLCLNLATLVVVFERKFEELRRKDDEKRVALTALEIADSDKGKALQVLRSDVLAALDQLWTNSTQKSILISSEKMAALRGERPVISRLEAQVLNFAVYTHQKPTNMLAMMSPVLAHLEGTMARSLSRPVLIDLRIFRHYDDAQRALVDGAADFMRVGPSTYIEAKRLNPAISLLLAQNGHIRGCIIVNAQAGITNLAALKGKTMAGVDANSTTGNYLPKVAMVEAGLTAKDLQGGGMIFLGSHDSVPKDVASHRYDAGACNASVAEKFLKEPGGALKVLLELPEDLRGLPWVAGSALPPSMTESIRAGLQSIRDKAILEGLGNNTTGFEKASDEDYDPLRVAMRKAEKFDDLPAKLPQAQRNR